MKKIAWLLIIGLMSFTEAFSVEPFLKTTEAWTKGNKKVIVKEVELWNGKTSAIDEKYTKSGKIINGESSFCPAANMDILEVSIKDKAGKTICLNMTAVTKPIQDILTNQMVENNIIKEEYKNKTISVTGYGWDNNTTDHTSLKKKPSKKMHLKHQNRDVKCDEYLRVFVYELKI
ncbi:MAG: hypothetical protein J6Y03_00085 [Alphaproteobacteria bacterium]|nr:hypothetical protein [Alphaproteobacteria bacterium]